MGRRHAHRGPGHTRDRLGSPDDTGTEPGGRSRAAGRAAGCEWLHLDSEEHLRELYFEICGSREAKAGLISSGSCLARRRDALSGTFTGRDANA